MPSAETIRIECLRCRHVGTVDPAVLRRYGLPPDVTLAELSRRLVCEACGSRAFKADRLAAHRERAEH